MASQTKIGLQSLTLPEKHHPVYGWIFGTNALIRHYVDPTIKASRE